MENNILVADQEMLNILEWANKEEQKVIEKLRREGRYKGGLDGEYQKLQDIKEERNRRLKEIQEKYSK